MRAGQGWQHHALPRAMYSLHSARQVWQEDSPSSRSVQPGGVDKHRQLRRAFPGSGLVHQVEGPADICICIPGKLCAVLSRLAASN